MNRLQGALGAVVLCGVGLAAYWGTTASPSALSSGNAQSARDDTGQASVGSAQGSPQTAGAARAQRIPDAIKSSDVAAASRQALESAERGVETGDLDALRSLRTAVDARAKDKLLSSQDDDALDLAIACLAEDPEAKEDAEAFFHDEPATALHMQVKRVCLGQ